MALEGQDVVSWAYDRLAADTGAGGVSTLLGGRIYRDQVPQSAALPALVVGLVSHVDVNTFGGNRVAASTQIDVHLIADGIAYAGINVAGARADAVLQNAGGLKSGTTVVELVRSRVQAYVETDAGKSYSHVVLTFGTPAYAT